MTGHSTFYQVLYMKDDQGNPRFGVHLNLSEPHIEEMYISRYAYGEREVAEKVIENLKTTDLTASVLGHNWWAYTRHSRYQFRSGTRKGIYRVVPA